MGRARFVALGLTAVLLAAPAAADHLVADTWVLYRPVVEQVQAVTAWGGAGPGLYTIVTQPVTGASRVDFVNPTEDASNPRVHELTKIPTKLGYAALGVDTDPYNTMYVSVGDTLAREPSLDAGVLCRYATAEPGEQFEWIHIAGLFDFSLRWQMPYGVAYHPNGALYFTDAALGTITRIRNNGPLCSNPSFSGAWTVDHDARYMPAEGSALGVTGIEVCPRGGTWFCTAQGNLLVVNSSTGILYEVPLLLDGTTGAPDFKLRFAPDHRVSALQIGPEGDLYYVESGLGRVRRVTLDYDFSFPPLVHGCPASGPSDVAVIGGTAYISNRSALGESDPMCPMPSVTRVVMTP